MTILGTKAVALFDKRGISPETAAKFGIYTARRRGDAMQADAGGDIIVFPFIEHGNVVNEKYRTLDKRFWQRKGGRKTFWNSDVLDDPALRAGTSPLIITEGEFDALSAIECGFPLTVSVPEGAPPATQGEQDRRRDFSDDRTGKFEFLWNNHARLIPIKRFVIASDADAGGQRLASELVRRLGAGRCQFISYPDGCKDLNEVLIKHGSNQVASMLNGARPYPVRGLYKRSEYPNVAQPQLISTGWGILDGEGNSGTLKLFAGELMVVTGIPSHGKSTWVLNLLVNIARMYGWRSALFSPEMPTVPYLDIKLHKIIGDGAEQFIEEYFTFIDNDPTGIDEVDLTLDWLLEKAKEAVQRDGIRIFVIDPWNEIEHARHRDESITEYVGRALRMLKRFARLHDIAVIVVAHPTKDVFERGKYRTPTLYDIEGSAHWFNKSDHGVVIERPDPYKDETVVSIAKVRFDGTGEKGSVRLRYRSATCRYEELDKAAPLFSGA